MLNTPIREQDSSFRRMFRMLSPLDLLLPLVMVGSIVGAVFTASDSAKLLVVKKEPLVAKLTAAVSNGADIGVVRHIYKQRVRERSSLILLIFNRSQDTFRSEDYYLFDIPLSDILQDIYAAQFVTKDAPNPALRAQLERLIREHTQTNPFDKLEPGQRETFENLRAKLSSNYEAVQSDLMRIGDELYAKNIAVEKYLRDATFNLWLSVFALFLSLVISAYQIFQSRERRMVEVFRRVVASSAQKDSAVPPEA